MLAWDTSMSPDHAVADEQETKGPDFEEDEELGDDDGDIEDDDLDADDTEDDPYEEYDDVGDESERRHHHPRREEWNG